MKNQRGTICFFNSNRVWGGGEKWHLGTALLMQGEKLRVTLFAQPESVLIRRARQAGIPSHEMGVSNMTFLNPFKVMKLTLLLRKLRVRVIFLNLPSDVKFAGISARLAGVEKIIYRRGSPVPVRNTIMNRFLFRHVLTHIIANSEKVKQNILQNNPEMVNDQKITIVYNGIDGSRSLQAGPCRERDDLHGVIIGTAGRLSQEKGQEWLIDMAGILRDKGLDFTLVIAGEGPLKDPLIRKTRSLGLEDNIHFKGFIADMDEFYCSLDLFVLTSYWEGCSNVILEAMDWGLPVVAFHNSSVPELVQDTVNGFLVKNGNAGDLAEKVELLSINNGLRLNYGKAGRQIAREKFNLQKSFDQLMALI